MKSRVFIVLVAIFLLVIFFTQFKLVNRPNSDNDEGIYLTSFLLVKKGHLPYKKTYFSQPPGFLLTVYPGFLMLGKTLQAARMTISLWSFIGLIIIIWIGYKIKKKWVGLLAISLLFFIPSYFNQALTFQSDILITTFSLISLLALLKFRENFRLPWLLLSVLFLNLAFWTKFDITFFPSFIIGLLLLFRESKVSIKDVLQIFLTIILVSIGFFVIFIFPFGIKEVFNNSILLRFQAASTSSTGITFFEYLKKDIVLSFIILSCLLLNIFKIKTIKYPQILIFIWVIFDLLILSIYRPLFSHHLVILIVPLIFLFSQTTENFINNKKIFQFIVLVILITSLSYRIFLAVKTSTKIINDQQKNVIKMVERDAGIDDFVVCDEEIINGFSGRLPPPELSDISNVRIKSNNLTQENFAKIINLYKPKLIIPWNGRLQSIKNINLILEDYLMTYQISDSIKIYTRIKK